MKKLYFLFILFTISVLAADTSLEVRADAFIPTSKPFRKIYGDVGVSYGVEASACMGCFDGWINFDWFQEHGRSHTEPGCKGDSTKIEIANLSFGVKLPYLVCDSFAPYLGIGPSVSKVYLKNKSHCFHEKVSKWAVGGIAKFGVHYYFCDCMFLDLFVDYLFLPVYFHKRVDIGGFKTGAGIGVLF